MGGCCMCEDWSTGLLHGQLGRSVVTQHHVVSGPELRMAPPFVLIRCQNDTCPANSASRVKRKRVRCGIRFRGEGETNMRALTQIENYLIHEFVEDFEDGLLSRRGLVRRVIGITGGVATAATALVA